jgi:hypothetical protein
MPTHSTSAYKDGQKWIVFCKKCGIEEPFESQECSERYVRLQELSEAKQLRQIDRDWGKKLPFKSGLPLDEEERKKYK